MTQTAAPVSNLTETLSGYLRGAIDRPLPEEVAEKAKHHILDTLAAMVSGSRLKPGRLAIRYVRGQGGRREALVAGSRVVTSAVNAALANAMLAHSDETDDSHAPSLTHPGCAVVPAALAMAERNGRSGEEMLRAVVLGYDICARITPALGINRLAESARSDRSSHGIGALWGAAVAAGALARPVRPSRTSGQTEGEDPSRASGRADAAGPAAVAGDLLSAKQWRYLISYTVQQTSGLACWVRDEEHVEKAFDFGGMAARNALAGATMVESGFTGVDDALSGPHNLFAGVAVEAQPEALVDGLGIRYEIMAANIKRWPVGSPIQAALDSLLELIQEHGLRAEDVERIVVRLPEDGARTVDNRHMPDINLQYLLAVTLLEGTLSFAASHDYRRMSNPKVLDVRRRIELVGDPELTYARPRRQGIVEVTRRDGRSLRHHTRAVRGTADNPMTRAEVEEKAVDLLTPILGASRADELAQRVWGLERVSDVRELRALLQA